MKRICLTIDNEKLFLSGREREIFLSLGKVLIARGDKTSSCSQLAKLTGHNHQSISKMCWMLLYKKFVRFKIIYVRKETRYVQARCFKLSRQGQMFFVKIFKEGEGKKEESHAEPDVHSQ